jgi:hypothetical protein
MAVTQAPVVGKPLKALPIGHVEIFEDGLSHLGVAVDLGQTEHTVKVLHHSGWNDVGLRRRADRIVPRNLQFSSSIRISISDIRASYPLFPELVQFETAE